MSAENRGNSTLHKRILSDIEGQILSGAWPPGYRLPFEVDLAERYGCSRMTVNKVMTQLSQAGLIERRKKSGTFVSHPRSQSAALEIWDIREEVESLGLAYGYRLISRELRNATKNDRDRLSLSALSEVVDVRCVHSAGGLPFCYESRLITVNVVPEAISVDFASLAPGRWLLSEILWTSAQHRISALGADVETSRNLDLAVGSACLVVDRTTWNGSAAVTWVRLIYPGDRHSLLAQFRR